MIRLNAATTLPNLAAPRVSSAAPSQGGAFALALASQQPTRPTNQPAAAAAPSDDDRQDLAATGSELPEAADPQLSAPPEPATAEPNAPIDLQRPGWRFAAKPGDDATDGQGDTDAGSSDGDESAKSEDDASAATTAPAPLPAALTPIGQPVPQPAADMPAAAAADPADATAAAPVPGQGGRATRFRDGQPPADAAADQATMATGAAAPAAKPVAQAPSLAAIAPFAPTAKAPAPAKPAAPTIEAKAETASKTGDTAPQAATPVVQNVAAQQPRMASHAAVAASLAAEASPINSGSATRRHVVDSLDGIAVASLGAAGTAAAASVQPAGDSQQPALDLGRQDWMASMIDQIETLRDADGGRTARIRLNPDAMGTVDISVRHDGDTVHVHFASDTAATRTLLGDSAPALAQLAEQRGIRLSQSSVDAGAGHAGNQQRQEAQQTRSTTSAPASAQADKAETSDDRIA